MRYKLFGMLVALLLCGRMVSADEGFAPTPEAVQPLLVGHELPTLVLKTSEGKMFDLNAENSKTPLVVVFYRGHW